METASPDRRGRTEIERVFGRRVRRAREVIGVSQAQIADALVGLGVKLSPSQVAKIERGERPTNVAEVEALRQVLHVDSVAKLFGERDWTQLELLRMEQGWNWGRLLARQDELRSRREALQHEMDVLRQRDIALNQVKGGDSGEHPETP